MQPPAILRHKRKIERSMASEMMIGAAGRWQ
jgi:hypothetical protein